jgi:multisubunit Na+/H+ antiporter MnhB subunit
VVLFAIVVGREPELSWQVRSMRFLSVVVVPLLAALAYYILTRLINICNSLSCTHLGFLVFC